MTTSTGHKRSRARRTVVPATPAPKQVDDAGRLQTAVFESTLEPHVLLRAIRDDDASIVDFAYLDANDVACEHMRMTRDVLRGTQVHDLYPEPAATETVTLYAGVLESHQPLALDDWAYPHQVAGRERYYDIRGVAVDDDVLSMSWREVTDRRRAAQALADSEGQFRLIAENALDVVIKCGADGAITWVSPSVSTVLGWEPHELLGRCSADLVHPDDAADVLEAIGVALASGRSTGSVEARYATRTGGWRWMRSTGRVIRDADGTVVSGIDSLRDIQSEVDGRARLAFERGHDPLTGLANRSHAVDRLESALAHDRDQLVVLSVSVDDFSEINEAFTHTAGDRVLVTVAERVVEAVGTSDQVARTGDNELCVLLTGTGTGAYLLDRLTRIQEAVAGPVLMGAQPIDVTVSIGVTAATGGTALDLMRDATTAVHQARSKGGNRWEFLDPEFTQEARQRLMVASGLRDALARGEVQAWYQPIVALPEGRLRGYEALSRWIRPDGAVVLPDEFIPVAEHSDLIVTLDLAILRQSLEAMKPLPACLHVAVNISASTLASSELYNSVLTALAQSGVNPQRLHLEVTETALVRVDDSIRSRMQSLVDLGVTWWVDDFGTGYSSITHLRDMPVRGLKLDRSFTSGIAEDARRMRLAQGLVGLAQGLGLATVAEGVETTDEARVLADQGWDMAQGWLFGRPRALATSEL